MQTYNGFIKEEMEARTRELEDKVAVLNKLKADLDVIKAKEIKLQVSVGYIVL